MYVYIYTHIYIYTYTYIHVYTYIYTYMCVYIYIYSHIYEYIYIYVCFCVYSGFLASQPRQLSTVTSSPRPLIPCPPRQVSGAGKVCRAWRPVVKAVRSQRGQTAWRGDASAAPLTVCVKQESGSAAAGCACVCALSWGVPCSAPCRRGGPLEPPAVCRPSLTRGVCPGGGGIASRRLLRRSVAWRDVA